MSTTTVAQLIEALSKLPPDAEVKCGYEKCRGYSTWMQYAPVDIANMEVIDYTSDKDRIKYPAMAGKIVVKLEAIQ